MCVAFVLLEKSVVCWQQMDGVTVWNNNPRTNGNQLHVSDSVKMNVVLDASHSWKHNLN